MIIYNVESASGKVGVEWVPWERAAIQYESMKGFWHNKTGNKIFWAYSDKRQTKEEALEALKGISEEDFFSIHKPVKMWNVGYKGMGFYIEPTLSGVIAEMQNAIENGSENEFEIKEIMMSKFELERLPEFTGF